MQFLSHSGDKMLIVQSTKSPAAPLFCCIIFALKREAF